MNIPPLGHLSIEIFDPEKLGVLTSLPPSDFVQSGDQTKKSNQSGRSGLEDEVVTRRRSIASIEG